MKKLLVITLLFSGIAMNARIHRVVEIQEKVVEEKPLPESQQGACPEGACIR